MSKPQDSPLSKVIANSSNYSQDKWQETLTQVANRFNKQYRNEAFDLPSEVEAMPIFQDWVAGKLNAKISSPFWELAKFQKNQRCLDIGCGVSFLIYPWKDWGTYFYGQEISTVARDALNARGSQLDSKLFKGVNLAPAHQLQYDQSFFDVAIATGWSCYFPLDYFSNVLTEVKRILKPGGIFIFDILNPEKPLVEDWAVLETYLGAEVFLEAIAKWENIIKASGAKVIKRQPGELFYLYKVSF